MNMEPDAAEREAILAEWIRLQDEPAPRSRQPYGCVTFLIALALLLAVTQLPKLFGWALPPSVLTVAQAILGLAMVVGLFFGVFVGSGRFAHACARAEDAIQWLEADPGTGDAAERRRHAVTLLFNAIVSDGPSTSGTFDAGKVRPRLGANLPYVLAVERVLKEERGLWPVFIESPPCES